MLFFILAIMNSQFKYLGIIVLISFIFNSCNKEKDEELPIYVYVDSI